MSWRDKAYNLTPVQLHDGLWFKREDLYLPYSDSGANGSKLRQMQYLVDKAKRNGSKAIISPAVSNSPQNLFAAVVCREFDMRCFIVTGGDANNKAFKYLKTARELHASIIHSKVAYPVGLNKIADRALGMVPKMTKVETNITVSEQAGTAKDIFDFHSVGALQVQNIPGDIDTLIIPCGSCNSVVAIMLGLVVHGVLSRGTIRKIVLLGIGSNGSRNIGYIPRRLQLMSPFAGVNLNAPYNYSFMPNPGAPVEVLHVDINGSGYCSYSDLMPYTHGPVEFHPRYEGKCFNYMAEHPETFAQLLSSGRTLFWVVGSDVK